jgi:streptogramin lyase
MLRCVQALFNTLASLARSPRRALIAVLLLSVVHSSLARAQAFSEFPIPTPNSGPVPTISMTAGSDGALWFTEGAANKIGRVTVSGVVTEFAVLTADSLPCGIASGPDGNIWFTEARANRVGRITAAGIMTEFLVPTPFADPAGITTGADGNLWFAERGAGKIARITPSGAITEFSLPTSAQPWAIVTGPAGNLWFTQLAGSIGRMSLSGEVTVFPIPTPQSFPRGIAVGPDGNLWFTEQDGNKIGRISTAGDVSEFAIPTAHVGADGIAAGADGNLWFTGSFSNRIGRITVSGEISEFPIPAANSAPSGIAPGSDFNVWFLETGANKIGRITTARAPAIALRVLPVAGSTPGANGTFFKTSVQLHNPGSAPIAGQIVFHASGTSGRDSDPALLYSLAPGQTQSIADLLPAMGRSGLGSADIEVVSGSPPFATARVFNDAGAAGTTGFTEEAIRPEEALSIGARGVLLLPADLTAFRFNIGVRTLDLGASITLTVHDALGAFVASVRRDFPAAYHLQQTATEFLSGSTLPPGGSVTVEIVSGSAIVYGATVDNITGDPSLQMAQAAP